MFLKVTAILLLSIEYLLAAENSTTVKTLQSPATSTSFGNTTTRETETTEVQNASNFVTENLLVIPNSSHQLHPEPKTSFEQNQNNYNFLRPRGKTKFVFQNTLQHVASNNESPRNEITIQDQNNYSVDEQSDDLQQQQQQQQQQEELQLATVKKEEFIQSELHNLAKDIAETELNREAGKTNTSPRPSSWKSFFSSIFPQGIMNVFHLSVTAEPHQKSKAQSTTRVERIINPNETYQNKRMTSEWSTLPITLPLATTPQLLITPPLPTASPIPPIQDALPTVSTEIINNEENKNGSLMTNKDVFDINSAAEGSEIPFETVIPMESSNIFHIHPLNCEENCGEETEDYVDGDQLSESGDDNVVAFSRESPKNIFYPTPKPLPYPGISNIRNTDIFYSGTGTQTSEEIIRENEKNFGQKLPLPYHPAKQLDDFQKEVEKQFDHNEVRIDAEANSRKFLKHFKGKYVKPQESEASQSSTFKGINHFELVASTIRPEINFVAQPSPVKPESQLHTYIYSAGFKPDSRTIEPPKSAAAPDSLSNYKTLVERPRSVKIENDNGPQDQSAGEKSSNSQNLFLPYPNSIKPESLLHTYIYSAQENNNNSVPSAGSEAPKPEITIPSSWITPNKNSDTKDISAEKIPNQTDTGSILYTTIHSITGPNDNEASSLFKPSPNDKTQNDNKNNVQLYSTNLKPESLLHTYIYSAHDKNNNNNNNNSISNAEPDKAPKSEDISFSWISNKPGQNIKSSPSSGTSGKTYLCSLDQIKSGDCPYSSTFSPNNFYQPKDIIEIQKSYEQQVKHTKPYVYYSLPPGQGPLLSTNPIRVAQAEDSQQSESLVIPESYQQRQQYLQDQQKQLNKQQDYFQQHELQQYQQKLQYQQQQKYIQEQKKQQEQLKQYQEQQQQQLQQYQQKQQQQEEQQLQQYQQKQQQQQEEQQQQKYQLEKQQQQLQQYQQKQQQQADQQEQQYQLENQLQQYQQKQQQKLEQQQQQYQLQKQQQQLQEYQQKQQDQQVQQYQLQQYQQKLQQQQEQQQQQQYQLQKQQQEKQQQLQQFLQVQEQQRNQQQMQKQQQQLQYYQPEQQKQQFQQQKQQEQQPKQQQQQEQQQNNEKPQKLIRYNTVKVEKVVQKPYPVPVKEIVEKIVERPVHVERIVEKPVNVPFPVREVVEKIIDRPYPVEKIIDRPVHIPYPVQVDHFIDRPYAVRVPVPVAVPVPVHQYIDRPYPVEKIVEKPIHVPYPVDKVVEKIIEKHIPVEVERIVEKPAPTKKPKKPSPVAAAVAAAVGIKNKNKFNPEDLLELVPPPVDQEDHDNYKTIPDDIEFILLDDYNGPVPLDNQGYPWNKPEKRAAKNHNIKRSPEFRRNLRVEYGFRPPLIPSVEIGEKGPI